MRRAGTILLTGVFLAGLGSAFAGRPVFHDLSRNELIARSDFVFAGWPSTAPATNRCSSEFGRWWVHKVLRGDSSFVGKVIAIAPANYAIFEAAKRAGGKLPSYPANRYGNGTIDREQSTSYLFTNRRADGCFELTAEGAQEHRFEEPEIEALLLGEKDCDLARRGFDYRIGKMPVECARDDECKLYYVNPKPCEPPYIWNKTAESLLDDKFTALQARARSACADRWKNSDACAAAVLPFRCRAGKCEAGFPKLSAGAKPDFKRAELAGDCAPHDALSVSISLVGANAKGARLNVNWWGDGKPVGDSGVFTITGKSPAMENGFHATYCPYAGGCRSLKSITLKVSLKGKDTDGMLEFSFTTEEDETFTGQVPAAWKKDAARVICG